jgi:Protein of unknown function (DUF2971)
MNLVYKYCNARGVDILQNLELKITPPNQFNDPFELTPHIICSNPADLAARWRQRHLMPLYLRQKKLGRFDGSYGEFQKFIDLHHGEWLNSWVTVAFKNVQKNLLDYQSKENGILCMSKRRDSILMWGHYCEKHRGLVVGFDSSYKLFHRLPLLYPVSYVPKRIKMEANWETNNPETQEAVYQMMSSKGEDWLYEQELRQFFKLSALKKKPFKGKTVGYFQPISPDAIVTVSLGVRCSKKLENKVRSLLSNPHFSHVKLDRAVLHESDFTLEFVNC